MIVSEARIAANRANARKSTGPRTPEGKERSRGNAFKHGMAGEGIALPVEDEAEVRRVFAEVREELAPEGEVATALVRRVALLMIRLDRCAVQESAGISARVLSAAPDFDEARLAEVDRLMAAIEDDPGGSVRKLRRMPEGVDRLVATWRAIRADVACTIEDRWTAAHRRMAENLAGRRVGDFGITRVEALARAIGGDFAHLGPDDAPGLDDPRRRAWARDRMADLIDAEVAGLLAHRATLDLGAIAASRARAADHALFDPTDSGKLARRYEAAAERGLFRALREIRRAGAAGPARAPIPAVPEPPPGPGSLEAAIAETQATAAQIRRMASFGVPAVDRPPPAPGRPPVPDRHASRDDRRPRNGPRDASTIVVGRT